MKTAYRALGFANKLVNLAEQYLQRPRLISRPVSVDVVLTKACNFACSFCKDYETPTGSKRISIENFQRLARQVFPTASRMNICSGGEPYLHNGLPEILRIARHYGLYTWLLSNGSIMKQDLVREMIDEELVTEHGFSIDGYRADTVEGIRLNAELPKILDNIRMVIRLREEMRKKNPTITIRYALMRSNIEELSDAIRQWGDMGIERLECGYLSLANGMDRNLSLYYHQDLMKRCFDEARAVAEQYRGLHLSLPDLISDDQQRTEPNKCEYPWDFIMIDTNGEVMPCYRAFEALRFPSLYEETERDGSTTAATPFKEIWNSEKYQRLRATVNDESSDRFFSYCEKCEHRCGWGREEAHLGDDTWFDVLAPQLVELEINHQRPLKGTAAKREKEAVS